MCESILDMDPTTATSVLFNCCHVCYLEPQGRRSVAGSHIYFRNGFCRQSSPPVWVRWMWRARKCRKLQDQSVACAGVQVTASPCCAEILEGQVCAMLAEVSWRGDCTGGGGLLDNEAAPITVAINIQSLPQTCSLSAPSSGLRPSLPPM